MNATQSIPTVAQPFQDQRREQRFACRRPIELLPGADASWNQLACQLLDCSIHGIGLIAPRALAAGEQFLLTLKLGSGAVILYTVRNCRPTDGGYRIGAEFTSYVVAPSQATRETIVDALMRGQL